AGPARFRPADPPGALARRVRGTAVPGLYPSRLNRARLSNKGPHRMLFEQLNEGPCRTYLVAAEQTREALLVDPALGQVDRYLQEISRRGLRLKYVLDTHVHADHLSAGAALRERAGVPYAMHRATQSTRADLRVDE